VVFAANLLFMIWWFCLDRLQAVGPNGAPTDSYDAISLQITILGVMMAAMAIGLGVAAIFGFQALRDHMFMRVDEQINLRLGRLGPKGGVSEGLTPKGPEIPGGANVAPVTEG
jgi:hypothetical protein